MGKHILVINPNSDNAVTAAMDSSLESLRFEGGPAISCVTLDDAPPGIETARHADQVVDPVCALIAREDHRASAFVIACFGDPGLASAREITNSPVFGICEGGVTSSLNYGERFGILTNVVADVNPGLRYLRALGLDARLAGIEAAGIAVVELGDESRARQGLSAAARRLKERGADVLVLGCAGMVAYAPFLAEETGLAIIDPVHAATGLAIAAVSSRESP